MSKGIKGLFLFHLPEFIMVLLSFCSIVGEKLGHVSPALFNPCSLLFLIDSKKSQGKDILTQCDRVAQSTTCGHRRESQKVWIVITSTVIAFFVIICQVITSGGIMFCDQPWHKECFVCSGCRKELCEEDFMSRDDYAFCLDCYNHLYAKKCATCTKPIIGELFSLIWSYHETGMAL